MVGFQRGLGLFIHPFNEDYRELRANRVKAPAEMIAVADSTGGAPIAFAILPWPDVQNAWPGKIHNGGSNVLFCDGHVQAYLPQELIPSDLNPSPENLRKRRMWNNDNRP